MSKVAWLPLGLSPYQRCCVFDCNRDAVTQFKLKIKDDILYLGACSNEDHIRSLIKLVDASKIEKRLIRQEELRLDFIMIQPKDQNKMCRYDLWLEQKEEDSKPMKITYKPSIPVIPLPEPTPLVERESVSNPKKPIDEWMFFEVCAKHTRDTWMNLEHQVISVYELSDAELVDAIISMQQINYQRIPRSLNWIEELRTNTVSKINITTHYTRYQEQLNIGTIKASKKLEVFKEVAILKKLIKETD